LQIQFVEQLAWVVALFSDDDNWRESQQVWELACSYTGYSRQALKDLPDLHRAEFSVARQEASLTVRTTDEGSRRTIEDTARHALTAIGARLRQNVALLVQPFDNKKADSVLNLHGAFLAGAQFLSKSNLRGVQLDSAILCGAYLAFSKLNRASLGFARLEGADLVEADLEGTVLIGARINKTTTFLMSNWWKADFGMTVYLGKARPESALLDDIIAEAGTPTAEQLREAHPSVREYVESLPRSASQGE
jgi:hypothetical protein